MLVLEFDQNDVLEGYYVLPRPSRAPFDRCADSDLLNGSFATTAGLRLGLRHDQVDRIFGKPTYFTNNEAIYSFLTRAKMTQGEGADLKLSVSSPARKTRVIDTRDAKRRLCQVLIANSDVNQNNCGNSMDPIQLKQKYQPSN